MQVCSNCGHLNTNGAVQCEECATLLDDRTLFTKSFNYPADQPSTSESAAFLQGATVPSECLLVLTPVGSDQAVPIQLTVTSYALLGRTSSGLGPNMVDLSALDAQKLGVSRKHVRLTIRGNTVQVMDLGSANGTFINDQRLLANQYYGLLDGDVLKLGHLPLQITLAVPQ